MAVQRLDPDDFELLVAMKQGVLPRCPFCGSHPMLSTAVNPEAPGDRVLYQGKVQCADYRCFASIIHNDLTREAAQQGAIATWSKRFPAPSTLNQDKAP